MMPDVVATVGLHGSASTWVFNVARELVAAAAGEDRVLTLYADEPGQLPDEAARRGKHVVVKSHQGSLELDAWLQDQGAPIILSLRDPRDACLSMAQRFAAPLQHTARWLANDCRRVARLAEQGHPYLRFEDRFFDEPASVARMAARLGMASDPALTDAIFARYRTEAVRDFSRRLEALPPERLTMVGPFRMDRITQILAPHIGDARTGKWRDLPASVQLELTRWFRPFLDRFGYAVSPPNHLRARKQDSSLKRNFGGRESSRRAAGDRPAVRSQNARRRDSVSQSIADWHSIHPGRRPAREPHSCQEATCCCPEG